MISFNLVYKVLLLSWINLKLVQQQKNKQIYYFCLFFFVFSEISNMDEIYFEIFQDLLLLLVNLCILISNYSNSLIWMKMQLFIPNIEKFYYNHNNNHLKNKIELFPLKLNMNQYMMFIHMIIMIHIIFLNVLKMLYMITMVIHIIHF